jgi:NTE family protein
MAILGEKRKKLGLVIGSGGIKTLGLASFFKLLDEYQIKPDVIVGSSGGSLLASHWASGATIDELTCLVKEYCNLLNNEPLKYKVNYRTLLSLPNYPFGYFDKSKGILKKERLYHFFQAKAGNRRLENCVPKMFILTTDVETGEPVLLKEGLIADCVYASCAIYPILPPMYLNNRWLVDGAYNSAIPVLEAVKLGCDKIIAISFEEKKAESSNSFFEFYMEFVSNVFNQNARKQNAFTIDLHHDEILFVNYYFDKCINFWDVNSLSYITEVSDEVVRKFKPDILEIFSQL